MFLFVVSVLPWKLISNFGSKYNFRFSVLAENGLISSVLMSMVSAPIFQLNWATVFFAICRMWGSKDEERELCECLWLKSGNIGSNWCVSVVCYVTGQVHSTDGCGQRTDSWSSICESSAVWSACQSTSCTSTVIQRQNKHQICGSRCSYWRDITGSVPLSCYCCQFNLLVILNHWFRYLARYPTS